MFFGLKDSFRCWRGVFGKSASLLLLSLFVILDWFATLVYSFISNCSNLGDLKISMKAEWYIFLVCRCLLNIMQKTDDAFKIGPVSWCLIQLSTCFQFISFIFKEKESLILWIVLALATICFSGVGMTEWSVTVIVVVVMILFVVVVVVVVAVIVVVVVVVVVVFGGPN